MPESGPQTFYLYEDAQGRTVIVDRLDAIPPIARPKLKTMTMSAKTPASTTSVGLEAATQAAQQAVEGALPGAGRVSGLLAQVSAGQASPLLGSGALLGVGAAGAGLLFTTVIVTLFSSSRWLKVVMFLATSALASTFYFSWVRTQAGVGTSAVLVTPATLLDDARRARRALLEASEQKERLLKQIQAEPSSDPGLLRATGVE